MKIPKAIKFIAVVITTSVPITIAMIMEKYHFLNGYFHIFQWLLIWFSLYYFREVASEENGFSRWAK